MRPDIEYYPFTKQQLLKAGEPEYVDRTPSMNSFISFLRKHYDLTDEVTDEITLQLVNMINMDSKPTALIQYLQSWLEFPSFEFVQQLTDKVMEVHNNTRMWVLKGYTPNELRPLPVEPFMENQSDSKIIDIKTRTKIGRNDPCPCGSGKKYKRCCEK